MNHEKTPKIPLKPNEILAGLAATGEESRDIRLVCEYCEIASRLKNLTALAGIMSQEKRKEMKLSPGALMALQIKGMKNYLNALSIRIHYELPGAAFDAACEKARALATSKNVNLTPCDNMIRDQMIILTGAPENA